MAHLMRENASLQDFEFLRALAPTMTLMEFTQRVARAFSPWPKELLKADLDRGALASTVQHNLFDGNPDGWNAYINYVQKKVEWFGTGLSNLEKDTLAEPSHDATNIAGPIDPAATAAQRAEANVRNEKRGWPWPEPTSRS